MRPLILVTNDDGIDSPGILAAVKAVMQLGDVLVIAPSSQQTGMGRSFPRTETLGVIKEKELKIDDISFKAYSIDGSPAYAVAYGVLEIADRKPDLCVSGINYGENVGMVLTCSGTLGATFEASSYGIKAMAVSRQVPLNTHHLEEFENLDWGKEILITSKWAADILKNGMQDNVDILNINIPYQIESKQPYVFTKQSRQNYFEFIKPNKRKLHEPFELKCEITYDLNKEDKNTDIYVLCKEKTVSVTQLSCNMSVV